MSDFKPAMTFCKGDPINPDPNAQVKQLAQTDPPFYAPFVLHMAQILRSNPKPRPHYSMHSLYCKRIRFRIALFWPEYMPVSASKPP